MTGGNWTAMLMGWLPVLLLIAVWVVMMQRGRSAYTGKGGKTHGEMLEEHLVEMRRQNDLLETIVKDNEARIAKLEQRRTNTTGASAARERPADRR